VTTRSSPGVGPVGAVLFDLDGTLLDHISAAKTAVIGWTRELAPTCDVSPDELSAAWAALEAEHFPVYLAGQCTFSEQRRRRVLAFLPQIGVEPSTIDPDEAFARYLRLYEAAWRPFPDVADALHASRSRVAVLAVLSNGDQQQQRAKVAAIGAEHLLDDVLASSSIGYAKPAPEAFLAACTALGVPPATTVYVGDHPANDAAAADAAGLIGVWLDRSKRRVDPPPRRRIGRLADLEPLLSRNAQ